MSNNEAPPEGEIPADEFLAQVEQVFTQGMAGGGLPSEEISPIGGFFAGPAGPIAPSGQFVGPYAQQTPDSIGDAYYEGDDLAALSAMNTEQLARFQDTLVANGLVREVIPGRLDDNTIKGMQTLMALGNRQSVTWDSVLEGITRAGGLPSGTSASAQDFDPSPYVVPDYATIAQEVKSVVRDRLGRDPDQGELAQLSAEWMGFDRARYNAEVEAQRAAFDAGTTPGTQSGATVQSVDPMARFQEMFERRYESELDFVEDKEDAKLSRAIVESGTSTLSRMSRGA